MTRTSAFLHLVQLQTLKEYRYGRREVLRRTRQLAAPSQCCESLSKTRVVFIRATLCAPPITRWCLWFDCVHLEEIRPAYLLACNKHVICWYASNRNPKRAYTSIAASKPPSAPLTPSLCSRGGRRRPPRAAGEKGNDASSFASRSTARQTGGRFRFNELIFLRSMPGWLQYTIYDHLFATNL